MTKAFILVVYLFLTTGETVQTKFDNATDTMEECQVMGRLEARKLWEKEGSPVDATSSYMCIDKQASKEGRI